MNSSFSDTQSIERNREIDRWFATHPIWPFDLAQERNGIVERVVRPFLTRLPEEAFDVITDRVTFIVEDIRHFALCVHLPVRGILLDDEHWATMSHANTAIVSQAELQWSLEDIRQFKLDEVVQMELEELRLMRKDCLLRSLRVTSVFAVYLGPLSLFLSDSAKIGLVAHEVAHCFRSERDYEADEKLADETARQWGFDKELSALRREKVQSANRFALFQNAFRDAIESMNQS